MKNTFAVSMTLLLAFVLGGSYFGYRLATAPHAAAAGQSAEATTPAPTPAETATNEAAAPAQAEPAGDAKAGQEKFAANCVACHGAQAKGGVGPDLTVANGPKTWTDAQFATTLRTGKTPTRELAPTMLRFNEPQLSDADIVNIHAFIKTLN